MFNPFCLLSPELLEAFIKSGKMYFVRQTFTRVNGRLNAPAKGAYLISHYSDMGSAQAHFGAIEGDKSRYLYDWSEIEHQLRLRLAASQPPGYGIYASVFQHNWEKLITDRVKEKMRSYISSLHWKPSRDETVYPDFYVQFGELYIKLRFQSQEVRVKFEDVEKQ